MSNCETVAVTFDVEDIAVDVVCVEPQIEVRVTMSPTWADVSDKPAAFAPSAHAASHAAGGSDPVTLSVGQVSGLQAALDSKATPADVTAAVSGLVNSAPAALDTLNELAAALGNDANFASTVTTALAAKAPLASPTFTGTVSGVTKGMVGLGNVDNTADSAKPVSTAQAAADAAVASAAAADATSKANAAQAAAVQRANHTGTQAIATVDGLQTALDGKVGTADSRLSDAREWSAATIDQAEAEAGTGTTRRAFTALRVFQAVAAWWAGSAAAAKLAGIATGATANATDAQLRDRSTHTGTQAAGTITGLAAIATSGSAGDLASGTVPIARIPTGSTGSTVCIGNDARLSDTRTPTAGSVTDASITAAGLSTSSLNWAAIQPWAANTAYSKGDLVSNAGIAYRRSAAGTSGATFNTANWQQITPSNPVISVDGNTGAVTITKAEVYEFTRGAKPASASGANGQYTWSIPAGAKFVEFYTISGGAGGGSGRRGAVGSACGGGGGGGSGDVKTCRVAVSSLESLFISIFVGAGGAGGAAVTANDTNGNNGVSGESSAVLYTSTSTAIIRHDSFGFRGVGGTTSGGAGGAGAWVHFSPGQHQTGGAGGNGVTAAAAPSVVSGNQGASPTAGGGGGGISTAEAVQPGGASQSPYRADGILSPSVGAAGGGAGGNGVTGFAMFGPAGGGGAGGGSSVSSAGGNGGNGAFPGGGGGGGGASRNGFNSGAGGNGGDGFVRITVWY